MAGLGGLSGPVDILPDNFLLSRVAEGGCLLLQELRLQTLYVLIGFSFRAEGALNSFSVLS